VGPEIQHVLPKYLQVADHIRGQIVRGELLPGQEVPSEREIAEEWRVSRPTATRALAVLRAEGLVEARQGSGTFVRTQPRLNRRALDRYVRSRQTGRVYTQGERSEITDSGWSPAPDEVAAALGIEKGQRAVRRRRVIYDTSGPVEVSVSWFPETVGKAAPKLLRTTRIKEGTLAYVEAATRRRGRTARDWIGTRLASAEEADALALGAGPHAVLVVRHTTFDEDGDPMEFVEATYPSGRWTFEDEYTIPG
jgi:GntR family transcriptional regulator